MTRDGKTVSYEYDADGRKVGQSYGGHTVSYEYDDAGRTSRVKLDGNVVREYSYNTLGQLEKITDYRTATSSAEQSFTYDWRGLLTGVTYQGPDGSVEESYTLTYDPGHRITQEVSTENYGGSTETVTKNYTYDDLGRLTSETENGVMTSYTYDAAGNRMTMTQGTDVWVYEYNSADQLVKISRNGVQEAVYSYDAAGNETSVSAGGETREYSYDEANQMIRAEQGESVLGEYSYDAAGQRLGKKVNGEETKQLYDGIDLLAAYSGDTVSELYVLEEDGSMICGLRGNDKYWYHMDSRGSITNVLDNEGSVVKSYEYDAYGNTQESGSFENTFAYTGAVVDEETGLYYMNARYYEPATGRFTSQDSFRGEGEAFWHLYLYCDSDPVNFTDPTGHITKSICNKKSSKRMWPAILGSPVYYNMSITYNSYNRYYYKVTRLKAAVYTYHPKGDWIKPKYLQILYFTINGKTLYRGKLKTPASLWSSKVTYRDTKEYSKTILVYKKASTSKRTFVMHWMSDVTAGESVPLVPYSGNSEKIRF